MADATASFAGSSFLKLLLKEYNLCRHCLSRQQANGTRKIIVRRRRNATASTRGKECYICKGLFGRLDEVIEKALLATRQYRQFDTFLVGATLPTQMYEREDALRARLKIRGREGVKNHLTKELGKHLAKKMMSGKKNKKKKADYMRPDLTINIEVGRDGKIGATARARPLALLCRYVKKERGLPQKAEKCPLCLGKGCNLCDGTGLADQQKSVEGIVSKHIMEMTGGQAPLKFSWIGSEDQSSLVLGTGRPFYARVPDPKTRKPRRTRFAEAGVKGRLVEVLDDLPDTQVRFVVKTRIACRCDRAVGPDDILNLKKSLAGAQAKFENRSKVAVKKIHSVVQAEKTGESEFALTIAADGGLPIKQFVGGEQYIEPSVSGLLGAKCECTTFDILQVNFLDSN